MGWDYTHATHYTRTGAIDKKAEIDELYAWQNDTKKYEVVRSCMVGATYYAAVKATVLSTGEAETFAAVALTHTNNRDYFNFGVKTKEESMGPCEDHCPASILSLLSPTDSEYANNWRERCRKNIEAKKDPHALKNLPVGAVIRFIKYNGEAVELMKHPAAYQFKRPFWYCKESGCYMPATRIPALKHLHNERCCVSSEIRGSRTAIDLILTVSNYGGEVTQNNRRMIESILA